VPTAFGHVARRAIFSTAEPDFLPPSQPAPSRGAAARVVRRGFRNRDIAIVPDDALAAIDPPWLFSASSWGLFDMQFDKAPIVLVPTPSRARDSRCCRASPS